MRVYLHPSGDYYVAEHGDGTVSRLERVSHILTQAGISPRFGRNALAAAQIGTEVHNIAARFLRTGFDPIDSLEVGPVLNAWVLWREWWDQAGLEPVHIEISLACERLAYGGTCDLVATDRTTGEIVLVDYKTSKPQTSDISKRAYQLQLAAYALALKEGLGEVVPTRAQIVRVGKEDAAPEVYTCWDNAEDAERAIEAWEHVCVFSWWMGCQAAAEAPQVSEEEAFAFR